MKQIFIFIALSEPLASGLVLFVLFEAKKQIHKELKGIFITTKRKQSVKDKALTTKTSSFPNQFPGPFQRVEPN